MLCRCVVMDVTMTIGFGVDVVLLTVADRFNTRISRQNINAVGRGQTFNALAERNYGADAAPPSSSESASFAKFLVRRDPDSALPCVCGVSRQTHAPTKLAVDAPQCSLTIVFCSLHKFSLALSRRIGLRRVDC